jgi:hypothetical protein
LRKWTDTHIQRWNGKNFVRKRTWLKELGLRVQLNHPPGVVCSYRFSAAKDFVLYDATGVHEINVDYCGCAQGEESCLEPRGLVASDDNHADYLRNRGTSQNVSNYELLGKALRLRFSSRSGNVYESRRAR